ncbi:uncharacterized protein BJ171DRAFT_17478 [Polychytrium aggregatum]|uniref:uncharacterized protein n=1 Tax=Polychytrium aggregatum TaxID=110093 RepID=UPI0022FF1438|nr:uncharacterized protein BJ171DRAFT_17478 [Polychytrium aggregatum]KAI9206687.1 hypothetical protein BJ171DRAFT_17478 [Polychytrium aggregatum]
MASVIPPRPPLRGSVVDSFAYVTIKDRLPIILTKAIDALHRYTHSLDADHPRAAGAADVVQRIAGLKYNLQRNKTLPDIQDQGDDAAAWNEALGLLQASGLPPTWFDGPWLFVECYMYRAVREALLLTPEWSSYDPFQSQKESSFYGSQQSVLSLSSFVAQVSENETKGALAKPRPDLDLDLDIDPEAYRFVTRQLVQFSLWGNQSDLSLLVHVHHADLHQMQKSGSESLSENEKHIVVNNEQILLDRLESLRFKESQIDIILDNAGFELFTDLMLADWLVRTKTASRIVFHAKAFPWFVSDVTPTDFEWTLQACAKLAAESGEAALALGSKVQDWQQWLRSGIWSVQVHPFWTLPYAFHELPRCAPELEEQLSRSDLLIFKGDLNYRKMVYDCEWPVTTPFGTAIGPLATARLPPFVMLRTNKANVCVGLDEGQEGRLVREDPDWMVSGKYGVIQYFAK